MRQNDQQGMIVVSVIITTFFLLLITTYVLQLTVNNFGLAKAETYRINAQLAADAGLDQAVAQLNEDDDWTGTGGQTELYNNGTIRETYEVTVTDGVDDAHKTVTAIGRVFSPVSSSTPKNTRTYEIEIEGLGTIVGSYSLVTGVGGLTMSNNSKILAGDVFVNGGISMSNSAQIGTAATPVTVRAAHQLCPVPADSTYPRVCNSGENGQPISLNHSSHIYAEVRATNQTSGTGMSNTGLVPNQTVAPLPLPDYDRDAQKAAYTSTQTGSAAGCSSGTKTWPANLRITGNVSISNTCRVTVAGDVWISGNLSLSNSSQLIVSDSLGGTEPVIMVDGSNGFSMSNGSAVTPNSSDTGAQIMTYYSTAGCSPDCADVTGTDLSSSRTRTTIQLSNSSSAPQTILYARWTQINISNSGLIGALVAQTIQLSNTASITFGTEVPIPGSTEYVWVVRSYKRVF